MSRPGLCDVPFNENRSRPSRRRLHQLHFQHRGALVVSAMPLRVPPPEPVYIAPEPYYPEPVYFGHRPVFDSYYGVYGWQRVRVPRY